MFLTKKERRQMWRNRIFTIMQAAVIEAGVAGAFILLLWLCN